MLCTFKRTRVASQQPWLQNVGGITIMQYCRSQIAMISWSFWSNRFCPYKVISWRLRTSGRYKQNINPSGVDMLWYTRQWSRLWPEYTLRWNVLWPPGWLISIFCSRYNWYSCPEVLHCCVQFQRTYVHVQSVNQLETGLWVGQILIKPSRASQRISHIASVLICKLNLSSYQRQWRPYVLAKYNRPLFLYSRSKSIHSIRWRNLSTPPLSQLSADWTESILGFSRRCICWG